MSTRWCGNGGGVQWLQVDLGEARHATGCQIDWESSKSAYRYKVEGSPDGQAWQTLADRAANKQPGAMVDKFDATVRFVKLTFLGAASGGWGSCWEFAVHGDQMTEVRGARRQTEKERALLREVKTPDGFEATIFAAPPMANYPVFVAAAPDGTLYVSSDGNGSLGRGRPSRPHPAAPRRRRRRPSRRNAAVRPGHRFAVRMVWDHDRLSCCTRT